MTSQPTYVIGHANPDTDSICSALAYTALRQAQGDENIVAARLGKLRPETSYALERFQIAPPLLLRDAYLRVADVMTTSITTLPSTASILELSALLRDGEARGVLLSDASGVLVGVAALGDLGRFFFEGLDPTISDSIPVELDNVLAALGGTVLYAARERKLRDKVTVGAMSVESIRSRVQRDALLVLGDREDAQRAAIERGIGALIVTGGYPVSPGVIDLARQHDVTVISVEHHTFTTVRLLHMSIPVSYVMNRNPQTCSPDDRLADVRDLLTRFPMLPVVDDSGRPVGILSRSDLLKPFRRRLILVDHNERGQSLPGLEEAEVLAIIDHHRIADVVTASPILFRAEPVGCTCTIIASLFDEAGIAIPPQIAGLMLAAIVNDTVLFRSPTCTPRDRATAMRLEAASGVSAAELADALFTRGSDLAGKSARDLLESDLKEYGVGKRQVGIGALEVTNLSILEPLLPDIREAMRQSRGERGYSTLFFIVVDVIHARSLVCIVGHEAAAARALECTLEQGWYLRLDRVVSRKKDIVPLLGQIDQSSELD